jgi:polar amino acid transport system substrate-binding protein
MRQESITSDGLPAIYIIPAVFYTYKKIFHQKRKIMRKAITVFSLLLLGTALLFGAGVQETNLSGLEYVMDRGELILGLDDSFPPMGFRDDNGEIAGFDIDLAKEVASRMGVELKLQTIDWDAKVLDLNSRNIDVIWNGLTITDERKEQIEFSKPYIANRQIVITRADSGIVTKSDLSGKKVGLQLGSSAEDAVNGEPAVLDTFENLYKYQDNIQALIDLENGNIDAVVVDEILGRYYIGKRVGTFAVASESFAQEQYGIGFRKGETDLVKRVDSIIDEMVEDGTAAEISRAWFGENIMLPR